MKVMFLVRSLDLGGAQRQLAALAVGLRERGHDVTVVTFYDGGAFAAELIEAGVRHVSLAKRSRWDFLGFGLRYRRCLRAERPEILHGYMPTANIIVALSRGTAPDRPRIIWGIRSSDMQLDRYDWMARLSYMVEARLSRFTDRIISNSKRGLETALERGIVLDRAMVIPNGIDVERFKPDAGKKFAVRAELGVQESDLLVGLPARFDPMKDHENFLTAMQQLADRGKDVSFVLVGTGTGQDNRALNELVESRNLQNQAHRLGPRVDMPAILAALDIVCLSSAFGEGFSNVLGESMAAGVPCVATDVGDARQIIGDTGEVVRAKDPIALADGVDRLLDRLNADPAAIRANARARIVENFSLEEMIDQTVTVLRAENTHVIR
jgi:glycosyltransferase involved in cell wall biosynthesis